MYTSCCRELSALCVWTEDLQVSMEVIHLANAESPNNLRWKILNSLAWHDLVVQISYQVPATKANTERIPHFHAPVFQTLDTDYFSKEHGRLGNRPTHFNCIELSEVISSCDVENRSAEVTVFVGRILFSKIVLSEVQSTAGQLQQGPENRSDLRLVAPWPALGHWNAQPQFEAVKQIILSAGEKSLGVLRGVVCFEIEK